MDKTEDKDYSETFLRASDTSDIDQTWLKINQSKLKVDNQIAKQHKQLAFSRVEAERQSLEAQKQARLQRIKEVWQQEQLIAREHTGKQFRQLIEQQQADKQRYLQYLEFVKQKQQLEDLKAQQLRDIETQRTNAELAAKLDEQRRKAQQDKAEAQLSNVVIVCIWL